VTNKGADTEATAGHIATDTEGSVQNDSDVQHETCDDSRVGYYIHNKLVCKTINFAETSVTVQFKKYLHYCGTSLPKILEHDGGQWQFKPIMLNNRPKTQINVIYTLPTVL
jgi:hypothetical protein